MPGHLAEGRDPIEARKQQRERDRPVPTFGEAADSLIAAIQKDWTNEKHRNQWKRALEIDAKLLRPMEVNKIEVEHVLKVLRPIWREKPEPSVVGDLWVQGWRSKSKPNRQSPMITSATPCYRTRPRAVAEFDHLR